MFYKKILFSLLIFQNSLNISVSFSIFINKPIINSYYKKRSDKITNLIYSDKRLGNPNEMGNPIKKTLYLGPGGFTMPYTLGICKYIKDNYDLSDYEFIGSSAGSWLAVYLASDINSNDINNLIDDYSLKFENGSSFLYKWHNTANFLITHFSNYIGNTTFIKEKKIGISVTIYNNKKITNEVIYNYDNLNELLNLCKLSSYIPFLSGYYFPRYDNKITVDSFFTSVSFKYDALIYFGTLNRTFKFREIIGRSKKKAYEYFEEGYTDAQNNKKYFDTTLH